MKNTTKKSASKSTKNVTPIRKSAKKLTKLSKNQKEAIERNRIEPTLKIVKTVDENPRRKNTFGYKSFQKIKNGMTVEQFIEKGGRLRDLHWDINKGYVKLSKKSA
mgnify:CR=1 FL=1|jgi:hypothetical protein